MKDLLTIYRVCGREVNGEKNPIRPPWFSKFKCWLSFYNSFVNYSDICVVWDSDKNDLSNYISSFPNVKMYYINEKSNQKSSLFCFDLAYKLQQYKYYYFLEDDYLHIPRSGLVMMSGISNFGLVTLYDHPDRYTQSSDYTYGQEYILWTEQCHWRTAESTTGTFAMNAAVFQKLLPDLISFTENGNGAMDDRKFFRNTLKKGIRLFSPIPGCSTHCVSPFLCPFVNWEAYNNSLNITK